MVFKMPNCTLYVPESRLGKQISLPNILTDPKTCARQLRTVIGNLSSTIFPDMGMKKNLSAEPTSSCAVKADASCAFTRFSSADSPKYLTS